MNNLPNELILEICRYLADDAVSLSALARVSTRTYDCAAAILKYNQTIDLSTGKTQVIHNVMAHVFALAHDENAKLPNVAIESTGDPFVDSLIKHVSNFKFLKLYVNDRDGVTSTVSSSVLKEYMSAVRFLESAETYGAKSWKSKFDRGKMEDLVRFLLRVARHITSFEIGGALYWMAQTSMTGMLSTLRTLKLVGIVNPSLTRSCCQILKLPTLEVLEFARMRVTVQTLQHLKGEVSVTSLHFVECWVAKGALNKMIKACGELDTFEYTLSAEIWSTLTGFKQYSLAQLISALSVRKETLKHLTILDPDCQARDRCHDASQLSSFAALKVLTINHDYLQPRHFGMVVSIEDFYRHHYPFIHPLHKMKTPTAIFLSLAPSLQRLELQICDKTLVTRTLLEVLKSMENDSEILHDLRTIKVTFERSHRFNLSRDRTELTALYAEYPRLNGRGRSAVLRTAAARVIDFDIELVTLPPAHQLRTAHS